ncbi:hypothetical protein AN1V17_51530 [Vallitalea sediminicola]
MTKIMKFSRYIAWLVIVLIIWGLAKVHPAFLDASRRLADGYNVYRVIYTIGSFLVGILLMIEHVVSGFVDGFSVMRFGLIISLSLLILLLVPFVIGMSITGFGIEFTIMQEGFFRGIIGVCGGVVFAQSITYDRDNR